MINIILHSWSLNMKFMKLVLFRYFDRRRLAKYRNYSTIFINFILNDHSSKILYLIAFNQANDMETAANSIVFTLPFTFQNLIVPIAFEYVQSWPP